VDTGSDTFDGDLSSAVALSGTLSDTPAVVTGGPDTGSDTFDGDLSSAVPLSGTLTGGSTAWVRTCRQSSPCPDTLSDTSGAVSDTSAGAVVVPDPLTIAVELVRNDRQVAGSRIAAAMRRHGHTVTDRTGLRWRDRAVTHLATELSRDLNDASNDEVQMAGATV
jgi:hypothetical protein